MVWALVAPKFLGKGKKPAWKGRKREMAAIVTISDFSSYEKPSHDILIYFHSTSLILKAHQYYVKYQLKETNS